MSNEIIKLNKKALSNDERLELLADFMLDKILEKLESDHKTNILKYLPERRIIIS